MEKTIKMQKFLFSYDQANDDLFLYSSTAKSDGSIEFGPLVLDFNAKHDLVGLQIMNACKVIKDIIGKNSSDIRQILSSLKSCKVESAVKNNLLIIKTTLISNSIEICPVLTMPNILEPKLSNNYT